MKNDFHLEPVKDFASENVKKKKEFITPRKNDFHLEPVKDLALENVKKKNLLLQGKMTFIWSQ